MAAVYDQLDGVALLAASQCAGHSHGDGCPTLEFRYVVVTGDFPIAAIAQGGRLDQGIIYK